MTSAPMSWQGGFARAEGPSTESCQIHGNMMLKMQFGLRASFSLAVCLHNFPANRQQRQNPTDVDTGTSASRLRREIDRLRDRKLGEYLDARRSSPFLTLPFHPPRLYLWSAPVSCKEQQQERTITFGPQRGGRW